MTAAAEGRTIPRPRRLAVVGHANVDHLLAVPSLPAPDRTVPVAVHEVKLGGTAANLALAAARLGLDTSLVTRIGVDFPPEFLDELRSADVDLRGVETVAGLPTPACYIAHDPRGGQSTLIDQGPMARGGPVPEEVLRRAGWVHLSTGDPGYLLAIQRFARTRGIPSTADPAQEVHFRWTPEQLGSLLRGSEILFGNEAEIRRAVQLAGERSPTNLLGVVPLIVMTRGSTGSRAYFRGGRLDAPAVRVGSIRDPTGAGDAFRAGFYRAWFDGEPLGRTLRAGAASAADWLRRRNRSHRRMRGRPR